MTHGRRQIVVQFGIVHQQSEAALVAVQFLSKLMSALQSLVHLVQCALHIETSQISCQSVGIIQHAVCLSYHTRNLLVETSHQGIQLTCRNGEVAGDGFHIMQRSSQSRVSQQCIHAGQDRIQLRQHLFHYRNQIGSLIHHTSVYSTRNDTTRFYSFARIVCQKQIHLQVAHQVFYNLGFTALRDSQILVNIHLYLDRTILLVIIFHTIHGTYLITIRINRRRGTQSLDVIKRHIIGVVGREQIHAFQKIDSEIHNQNTDNSYKSYLDFFC